MPIEELGDGTGKRQIIHYNCIYFFIVKGTKNRMIQNWAVKHIYSSKGLDAMKQSILSKDKDQDKIFEFVDRQLNLEDKGDKLDIILDHDPSMNLYSKDIEIIKKMEDHTKTSYILLLRYNSKYYTLYVKRWYENMNKQVCMDNEIEVITKLSNEDVCLGQILTLLNKDIGEIMTNFPFMRKYIKIVKSNTYLFYLTEYIDDERLNLERICGKLNLYERLNVILLLFVMLPALHEHGIIHGDIKTSNLIYTEEKLIIDNFIYALFINKIDPYKKISTGTAKYSLTKDMYNNDKPIKPNFCLDIWPICQIIRDLNLEGHIPGVLEKIHTLCQNNPKEKFYNDKNIAIIKAINVDLTVAINQTNSGPQFNFPEIGDIYDIDFIIIQKHRVFYGSQHIFNREYLIDKNDPNMHELVKSAVNLYSRITLKNVIHEGPEYTFYEIFIDGNQYFLTMRPLYNCHDIELEIHNIRKLLKLQGDIPILQYLYIWTTKGYELYLSKYEQNNYYFEFGRYDPFIYYSRVLKAINSLLKYNFVNGYIKNENTLMTDSRVYFLDTRFCRSLSSDPKDPLSIKNGEDKEVLYDVNFDISLLNETFKDFDYVRCIKYFYKNNLCTDVSDLFNLYETIFYGKNYFPEYLNPLQLKEFIVDGKNLDLPFSLSHQDKFILTDFDNFEFDIDIYKEFDEMIDNVEKLNEEMSKYFLLIISFTRYKNKLYMVSTYDEEYKLLSGFNFEEDIYKIKLFMCLCNGLMTLHEKNYYLDYLDADYIIWCEKYSTFYFNNLHLSKSIKNNYSKLNENWRSIHKIFESKKIYDYISGIKHIITRLMDEKTNLKTDMEMEYSKLKRVLYLFKY